MLEQMPNESNRRRKPGLDPERLKLPHEDWGDAVREALEPKRPEGGDEEEENEEPEDDG